MLRSFPANASLHCLPGRNRFLIAQRFTNSSRVAGEVMIPVIRFRQFFWERVLWNDFYLPLPFRGPPDAPDPIEGLFGKPVSISVDVNHVARKSHLLSPTLENAHLVAACQQMVSEMPPDKSCSA
jgi:hypothetical protein